MFDVQFLIEDQGSIVSISDAYAKEKRIVLYELLEGQLLKRLELIVPPAFADLKSGAVFSLDVVGRLHRVQQLDPIFVFILGSQGFGHLYEY